MLCIKFEVMPISFGLGFNYDVLNCVTGQIYINVQKHIYYYLFWPNQFALVIFGLLRIKICVFINFYFCFISSLHIVHILYEFVYYLWNHNRNFVLLVFNILLIIESLYIYLDCVTTTIDFGSFILSFERIVKRWVKR
jgi:hypothetical protein